MDRGALDHALETGGRLRLSRPVGDKAGEVLVEEFRQVALQLLGIHAAGAEHGGRIRVVGQGEQQVLEGGVFVATLIRQSEGPVERLLEVAGQHAGDAP